MAKWSFLADPLNCVPAKCDNRSNPFNHIQKYGKMIYVKCVI